MTRLSIVANIVEQNFRIKFKESSGCSGPRWRRTRKPWQRSCRGFEYQSGEVKFISTRLYYFHCKPRLICWMWFVVYVGKVKQKTTLLLLLYIEKIYLHCCFIPSVKNIFLTTRYTKCLNHFKIEILML